ncbi:MAG TPA: hypothetical protein VEK73_00600, partial [Xanthobacteraceae bacterium]|nr:hypothetical protein [Xanthobacteraceae bacterium]
ETIEIAREQMRIERQRQAQAIGKLRRRRGRPVHDAGLKFLLVADHARLWSANGKGATATLRMTPAIPERA